MVFKKALIVESHFAATIPNEKGFLWLFTTVFKNRFKNSRVAVLCN